MRLQKGQTLLEILLAFSVSILILSAVIMGVVTSLNNVQYTKNQGLANSYAQEGMAVIRQIKDSSWKNFLDQDQENYCIGQDSKLVTRANSPGSTSTNCGKNVGIFSREATIEHDDVSAGCSSGAFNGSRVTVKVSWSDSKCAVGKPYCHNVELITCFSNVDKKELP